MTFYTNGIANADKLDITGDNLAYLKAALVEEQIHQQFFTANGGKSLADTFSFPQGPQTFTDLKTFIATQQQLDAICQKDWVFRSFGAACSLSEKAQKYVVSMLQE